MSDINNLKAWMDGRGLSDEQLIWWLDYERTIMVDHARSGEKNMPSKCFVEKMDMVFGVAETNKAIANAPQIRKRRGISLSEKKIDSLKRRIALGEAQGRKR